MTQAWSQGSSDGRTGRSGAAEGGSLRSGNATAPPYFDARDLNLARDIRCLSAHMVHMCAFMFIVDLNTSI